MWADRYVTCSCGCKTFQSKVLNNSLWLLCTVCRKKESFPLEDIEDQDIPF